MKLKTIFFSIFFLSYIVGANAFCFCKRERYLEFLKGSEYVFVGKVISIQKETSLIPPINLYHPYSITFEVVEYLKGAYASQWKVIKLLGSNNYSHFQIDSIYIVPASRMGFSGLLEVNALGCCSSVEVNSWPKQYGILDSLRVYDDVRYYRSERYSDVASIDSIISETLNRRDVSNRAINDVKKYSSYFFISLALNIVLFSLFLFYFLRKTRRN